MKRALLHATDLASLSLAAPSCFAALLCSWRSGGSGVGRHAVFGCLSASAPASSAAAAAAGHGVTITACEAALLAAFCSLQAMRLFTSAVRLLTDAGSRLQLHSMATGLLLVATGSVAVNNPDSFLYGAGLALQFTALVVQLGGLGLAIAVFLDEADVGVDGDGEGGQPVDVDSFRRQPANEQRLPFADEEERLVYEFSNGRIEWRLGPDRGCNDLMRHSTV